MRIDAIDWKLLDTERKILLNKLLLNSIEKVNKDIGQSESDPCWIWQGAHAGSGMPHMTITVKGRQRQIGLNRVAWHIFHGMPLEGSKNIQIRKNTEACDEQMCWNPDHYDSVETDTE